MFLCFSVIVGERVRCCVFFFQAEDGIRDLVRSRGLGDVYKRQRRGRRQYPVTVRTRFFRRDREVGVDGRVEGACRGLSLIHI